MRNSEQIAKEVMEHCVRLVPYKGYRSTMCGDGAVLFVGPNGEEVKGSSTEREDWLTPAWIEAKTEIDRRAAVRN